MNINKNRTSGLHHKRKPPERQGSEGSFRFLLTNFPGKENSMSNIPKLNCYDNLPLFAWSDKRLVKRAPLSLTVSLIQHRQKVSPSMARLIAEQHYGVSI